MVFALFRTAATFSAVTRSVTRSRTSRSAWTATKRRFPTSEDEKRRKEKKTPVISRPEIGHDPVLKIFVVGSGVSNFRYLINWSEAKIERKRAGEAQLTVYFRKENVFGREKEANTDVYRDGHTVGA